jgi:hypothetical protein
MFILRKAVADPTFGENEGLPLLGCWRSVHQNLSPSFYFSRNKADDETRNRTKAYQEMMFL